VVKWWHLLNLTNGIVTILQDSPVVIVRVMLSVLTRCRVTFVPMDVSGKFLPRQRWFDGSLYLVCGLGSLVSIATGYGLDGPGTESRWGREFPHVSRPALGSTRPPNTMGTGFFPGVKSGWGVPLTPHPLLVPWSRRVELYLYSSYGPYGLHRASVPVQECALPFY